MHNLDKKDIAIIRELDFDARVSISSLARKVRVSKEVANYRLKKLVEENVIKSFNAVVDPYILGYQIYSLRIKFKQASQQKKEELVAWARANGNTARIARLGGKWDLSIFFLARSPPDFSKLYDHVLLKYGQYILKKTLSVTISIEHRPYNFLYDKPSSESITIGSAGTVSVDEKDFEILDILSKNCRTPLIDIAKKTKLTANAVKYRMKNLEAKKIIKGYSTVLNNKYFDLAHYRVTMYLMDPSKKKEAREFLRNQKDVIMITDLFGLGDVRFEILCPSVLRIYALVDELNKVCPDLVRDFDEIIMLEEEVIDYFPNE
jgi:Lrp/AsnC family transcriptional regulator, regulator for asnA, asnC and gidA